MWPYMSLWPLTSLPCSQCWFVNCVFVIVGLFVFRLFCESDKTMKFVFCAFEILHGVCLRFFVSAAGLQVNWDYCMKTDDKIYVRHFGHTTIQLQRCFSSSTLQRFASISDLFIFWSLDIMQGKNRIFQRNYFRPQTIDTEIKIDLKKNVQTLIRFTGIANYFCPSKVEFWISIWAWKFMKLFHRIENSSSWWYENTRTRRRVKSLQ